MGTSCVRPASPAPRRLEGGGHAPHREIVRTAYEKDLPETFEEIGIRWSRPSEFFWTSSGSEGRGDPLAKKFSSRGTTPFIPTPGLPRRNSHQRNPLRLETFLGRHIMAAA
jgi:hypothetical protein